MLADMRAWIAALLGLLAAPAVGQSLQGQWIVSGRPNYQGTMQVDAERRTTWESPDDNGRPARFRGVLAPDADPGFVETVMTDGRRVVRMRCTVKSVDVLLCRAHREDAVSDPFWLTRVQDVVPPLFVPR